jgi:hypothetical protein
VSVFAAACGARAFAPITADEASRASAAWEEARRRADPRQDANLLYDAAISQGVASTHGTLAVRLRGETAEGTLSGAMGATLATYRDGVLRGEKLEPVRLPERQLRAVLAGVWTDAPPEVRGQRGSEVLLQWGEPDAAAGVFDLGRGELVRLTVRRAEGELEATYAGTRAPWPQKIDIAEKKTGSRLKLTLLSREAAS